jgi:uncharacterized protein (TIGR02145 family)
MKQFLLFIFVAYAFSSNTEMYAQPNLTHVNNVNAAGNATLYWDVFASVGGEEFIRNEIQVYDIPGVLLSPSPHLVGPNTETGVLPTGWVMPSFLYNANAEAHCFTAVQITSMDGGTTDDISPTSPTLCSIHVDASIGAGPDEVDLVWNSPYAVSGESAWGDFFLERLNEFTAIWDTIAIIPDSQNGGSFTDNPGPCVSVNIYRVRQTASNGIDVHESNSTDLLALEVDICGVLGGDGSSCVQACLDDDDAVSAVGGCFNAVDLFGCSFYWDDVLISELCPESCDNCPCDNDVNDNGVCDDVEVFGCTYLDAVNYNSFATADNGSCEFEVTDNFCPADLDGNGVVATQDLLSFLSLFGIICDNTLFQNCGDQLYYQGYTYSTVLIGEQCWFAENCRYLPTVSSYQTGSEDEPVYYVYDYTGYDVNEAKSTENYDSYGVLYNYPAVMTDGICPSGWHIPSDDEWINLEMSLGMTEGEANNFGWRGTDQGYTMKSSSVWNGSNSSGFNGIPSGYRSSTGFHNDGTSGVWWAPAESTTYSWTRELYYYFDNVLRDYYVQPSGYALSARCIKN